MDAKQFVGVLQEEPIVKAIQELEEKTTGGIRIFISRKKPKDAMRTAQRRFVKMEMDQSDDRNHVLLYVAPRARKFALLGDREFNAKCGEVFWRETTNELSGYFQKKQYTEGVLHAIKRVGEVLIEHYPAKK